MGHFYFVRHGQSLWNVENKICGATDVALTEEGHRQADALAKKIVEEKIQFDAILCSPLIRARDTARHISELTGVPLKEEQRLCEQNFGKYEGTPRDGKEFQKAKENFLDSFGDGESMMKLGQRIYNLLDEIKEKSGEKTYLLVAHNGIARVVCSYFQNMTNQEYARMGIDNCEIRRFDFPD
ncbi:MAG: histidine phosphatase family protein [Lachnospiraceae bacterium]|nr:histidine phosphatase family protein [Lachnospiraceae bacterium]MDE6982431.1 histidine phosphatase family protein [Lachnospiraceae bacterium]